MRTILLTGGTGTFGRAFLERVLPTGVTVRVYSRDELKQSELRQEFPAVNVRFLIGDVRDRERLAYAAEGCDTIVHAAALKQVPSCEANPFECVRTNVVGTENVVKAALAHHVPKVLLISSDKAVAPINTYGASKLLAEKIVVAANAYAGPHVARFSAVRYGNVVGSRGSIHELVASGKPVTIRHPEATRFWFEKPKAIQFVLDALGRMRGGEIFVPKLPSGLVRDVVGDLHHLGDGLYPGEKLHETLLTAEEAARTDDEKWAYVIRPAPHKGNLPAGFVYTSEVAA